MATSCPIGLDTTRLREQVRNTYERVAAAPQSGFHFNVGMDYAVEQLRYDRAELEAVPLASTSRFAGVGNPLRAGPIAPGATVLDHACGAGTDLLLAARRIGAGGRAIGIDLTPGMREIAAASARSAGLANVEVLDGMFEDVPVDDQSIDIVLSNGVVNLAPDKPRVFAEVARVLRAGGWLYLSDVVVDRDLAPEARANADLWAACVGGAVMVRDLCDLATAAGLVDIAIVETYDAFANTRVAHKFHLGLGIGAVTLRARRPAIR